MDGMTGHDDMETQADCLGCGRNLSGTGCICWTRLLVDMGWTPSVCPRGYGDCRQARIVVEYCDDDPDEEDTE